MHAPERLETPTLVVLCGRSFSGKTTFATAASSALGLTHISLDEINRSRGFQPGQDISPQNWMRTHELARQSTAEELRSGRSVVIDDTSSLRFLRDAWRDLATTENARFVLAHLEVDEATLVDRLHTNRSRRSRDDVDDDVMANHLAAFETPESDESPLQLDQDGGDMLGALAAELKRW